MVSVTVTFDPGNEADVAQAKAVLDQFGPGNTTITTDPDVVHQKVLTLLRGYGPHRIEYIRAVAKASPERASYAELVAIVGSPKAIGGTHSSIERAWRAKGMPAPFIETDREGNARMDMKLADIVLFALQELDGRHPLKAGQY
jgi:hypothetical protein